MTKNINCQQTMMRSDKTPQMPCTVQFTHIQAGCVCVCVHVTLHSLKHCMYNAGTYSSEMLRSKLFMRQYCTFRTSDTTKKRLRWRPGKKSCDDIRGGGGEMIAASCRRTLGPHKAHCWGLRRIRLANASNRIPIRYVKWMDFLA